MLQKKNIKLENLCGPQKKLQNLINVGSLISLQGLEKNPRLINVGPMFIPDCRVIEKAETHNEQANNIQIRINPDQFPFISTLSKFHQKSFNVDSMQIIRVFVKSFYDAKIRFPSNFHQKCFNVDSMQNHLCFLKNVLRRKNKICFPTSQTTS